MKPSDVFLLIATSDEDIVNYADNAFDALQDSWNAALIMFTRGGKTKRKFPKTESVKWNQKCR